jgi:hypothetical protein
MCRSGGIHMNFKVPMWLALQKHVMEPSRTSSLGLCYGLGHLRPVHPDSLAALLLPLIPHASSRLLQIIPLASSPSLFRFVSQHILICFQSNLFKFVLTPKCPGRHFLAFGWVRRAVEHRKRAFFIQKKVV